MPSGICHKKYGLQNKVDAVVSTCGTKINIVCEHPSSMSDGICLQDVLSTGAATGSTKCTHASTQCNILQAFDKELFTMRVKNKVSSNSMLGSTAVISLPFRVEHETIKCQPNLDFKTDSVNLYIIVKRIAAVVEHTVGNMMQVRVSRAHHSNSKKHELEYKQESVGSSNLDTVCKNQAFLLQKDAFNKK
jgi:hypothetical protein